MITMTPADARDRFEALVSKIGPRASWSVYLSSYRREKPLNFSVYPKESYSSGALFACTADTWEELVEGAEAGWVAHCDEHARRTTLDMALAIIRITDASGACSDQALRAEFDAADVKRFGANACAKANEMAGRGPFEITETVGANDCAQAA